MKHTNWNQLSRQEKLREATDLFTSPRGKYIVSQALCTAIQTLNQDTTASPETSNVEDMEMLYATLFDQFSRSGSHGKDLAVEAIEDRSAA